MRKASALRPVRIRPDVAFEQFVRFLHRFFESSGADGIVGLGGSGANDNIRNLIRHYGQFAVAITGGNGREQFLRFVEIALAIVGHAETVTGDAGIGEFGILLDDKAHIA